MSENALTVIQPNPNQALTVGGVGIDFSSPLFRLEPATININQPNTQAVGAIPGKLRISETGDQFDEMFVTLLNMPEEQRQCYTGEAGQLNRSPENLICFARNVQRDPYTRRELQGPHPKAKFPQALKCHGCPKASWDKWRQDKRKENLPQCDDFYTALLIDTVYKLPMRIYVRSKSKGPFEAAMQNISRTLYKLKSKGLPYNIYDVRFKLSTEKILTGKLPSYVFKFSDFQVISEAEREAFGEVYQQFVKGGAPSEEAKTDDQMIADAQTIESQVVEPGTEGNVIEGEIQI